MATEIKNVQDRDREIVGQIAPSDMLGNQRGDLLNMEVNAELMLGVIMGEARGLSFRANAMDENVPTIALVGPFEFVPYSTERPVLRSLRCFLPPTLHAVVVTALQGDTPAPVKKAPKRGQAVDVQLKAKVTLAVEIGARHVAGAGVGYEYITREVKGHQIELDDPLAALRGSLAEKLSLPAPAPPMKLIGSNKPVDAPDEIAKPKSPPKKRK